MYGRLVSGVHFRIRNSCDTIALLVEFKKDCNILAICDYEKFGDTDRTV